MIELAGVEKIYSQKTRIGPLNLNFAEGSLTCIIGPNGAGKSTTLHMIGRLVRMDAGIIRIDGMDVTNTDGAKLAKITAILRQENHFVTRLTVRQLVSFGRYPWTKGRLTVDDEQIISKYIDFFGLSELERRYLDELSGGQRQRAYVAMVMCQETKYILLDEPLNNLDVSRSVAMMKKLKAACDNFKRTIIAVMHDINFSAQYADYICAMKAGSIIAYDSADKIMQANILSSLYDTNIEIIDTHRGKIALY